MRNKLISLVAASAFAIALTAPANAGFESFHHFHHFKHFHHVKGGGGGGGAWIAGGIILSAASIITCAMIVSNKYNRELTQEEAWTAAAIPLGCLLVQPKPTTVAAVRARG